MEEMRGGEIHEGESMEEMRGVERECVGESVRESHRGEIRGDDARGRRRVCVGESVRESERRGGEIRGGDARGERVCLGESVRERRGAEIRGGEYIYE